MANKIIHPILVLIHTRRSLYWDADLHLFMEFRGISTKIQLYSEINYFIFNIVFSVMDLELVSNCKIQFVEGNED